MIIAAKLLWIAGSVIFILLGAIHLLYTFFTDKFSSKNPEVVHRMKESHPVITRKTTIWRAWIGFNASHSTGALFFGLSNLILAFENFQLIQHTFVWQATRFITVLFYFFIGKKYWFDVPVIGISLSCLFYFTSILLIFADKSCL